MAGTSPPAASASDGSGSSTGSGISRSVRTGESSTGRTASDIPIAPTQIAVRRPNHEASAPPSSAPSGITPQTMKRITEFIRPCSRSGVIACRKLTWVML